MQRGISMIELMITLTIIAMVLFFGIPGFGAWLQSSQIRTASESIQNGLQLARSEAIRRNTSVQFVLFSLVDGGVGSDWVVGCVAPTDDCPAATKASPGIQKRFATDGSVNAAVASGQSTVVFNGLGRVTPAADITLSITNPTGGSCAQAGGNMRCLKVLVSSGGHVHMCDPALPATNPRGC